jgi:hypothetical protein
MTAKRGEIAQARTNQPIGFLPRPFAAIATPTAKTTQITISPPSICDSFLVQLKAETSRPQFVASVNLNYCCKLGFGVRRICACSTRMRKVLTGAKSHEWCCILIRVKKLTTPAERSRAIYRAPNG